MSKATTRSRFAVITMMIAAVFAAMALLGTPALAATAPSTSPVAAAVVVPNWNCCSYISSNSGGANIRGCPSTSCYSAGYYSNGTAVVMVCWWDTATIVYPPASNYASNRWFQVNLPGASGYIHSSLVANQASVPKCPLAP